MPPQAPAHDLVVVGGGIIGLAVAWRARRRGLSVLVLERRAVGEECASTVAAGMLAPVSELEFGEAARHALELGACSARLWPRFAAELEEASALDGDTKAGTAAAGAPTMQSVGLRRSGTLLVARDADEARELERQLALRESLGLRVARLRPSAARELEPALAPTVRLALEAPDDHSVDPRRVLAALRRACELAGVQVREHTPVVRVDCEDAAHGAHGRLTGVTLADGARVSAVHVVLAAGAWAGEIEGLPAHARVAVRPVKGQILRLRDPEGPGLLQRVLRFEGGYIVPRGDGRYVLGATVEERGFERRATAGGVYELLRRAREIVPGILELQIEELSVGFRPTTPDNLPVIGCGTLDGLLWAAGHHRNGVLLAPLTAELLVDSLPARAADVGGSQPASRPQPALPSTWTEGPSRWIDGDTSRALLSACDPRRFAAGSDRAGTDRPGPLLEVRS
jgi:glycine oxidase